MPTLGVNIRYLLILNAIRQLAIVEKEFSAGKCDFPYSLVDSCRNCSKGEKT